MIHFLVVENKCVSIFQIVPEWLIKYKKDFYSKYVKNR